MLEELTGNRPFHIATYAIRRGLDDGANTESKHGNPERLPSTQSVADRKIDETSRQTAHIVARDLHGATCH